MSKLIIIGYSPLKNIFDKIIDQKVRYLPQLKNEIEYIEGDEILANKNLTQENDVILCGYHTYEVLKSLKVKGHLVPIRIMTNDFLRVLMEARKYGKEVNIVTFKDDFIQCNIDEL